jgi:glutamate racemase
VRIALVDSGLGLLNTAAELRGRHPDVELVLSMDPDFMPWGGRPDREVIRRTLFAARAAVALGPDVLILACNSGSVVALDRVRREFEPDLPILGTVPAIKPAVAGGGPVAVWSTMTTASSRYIQTKLIRRYARPAGVDVHLISCVGLAEAIERGDEPAYARLVEEAAAETPTGVRAVVLGCTHYGLIEDRIRAELGPDVELYDSAPAVATHAVHRFHEEVEGKRRPREPLRGGPVAVLLSGRPASLPPAAFQYEAGPSLAAPPAAAPPPGGRRPAVVEAGVLR